MIEALAILVVFLLAVAIYLMARFTGAVEDPARDREHLEQYLAWLEYRRVQAELHGYDEAMKTQIAEQLAQARLQLARVQAR